MGPGGGIIETRFVAAAYGLSCSSCFNDECNLMSCSRCHRASYCNSTCQKNDWKKHKKECKMHIALTTYLKPLPMSSQKNRLALIHVACSTLYPEKKTEEFRIFHYDKTCPICFKSPYHTGHNAKEWYSCDICQFGWCCSKAHWEEYALGHTSTICALYKASIQDEKFLFEHWKKYKERFTYVPQKIPSTSEIKQIKTSFPLSWDAYFQLREPELFKARGYKLPHNFFRCTTDSLSQICTTLLGMEIFKLLSSNQSSLRIHVIGASEYEFPASSAWEEIMHLLPNVLEMDICCIGPDVGLMFKNKKNYSCLDVQTCPDCADAGRVRNVSSYGGLYHDFKTTPDFISPDLCVAFNTGLHEVCVESWATTVNCLLDMNVPCVFTSFEEVEAQKDGKALRALQAHVVQGPEPNPFRAQSPMIDTERIDKFYQRNNYVVCFQGRMKM